MTAKLLDESVSIHGGREYTLTRTYRLPSASEKHYTVQVTVTRNSYMDQSWAAAKVLSTSLEWTTVAVAPAEEWFDSTALTHVVDINPSKRDYARKQLTAVSDALVSRANRILRDA